MATGIMFPPIWITPNFIFNGLLNFTIKPFIVYNGNHRLQKGIEHKLPIKAYIRYMPFNPVIPSEERLLPDIAY